MNLSTISDTPKIAIPIDLLRHPYNSVALPCNTVKTETRPGLVTLYDIRPGNGEGLFLQPRSPHGACIERQTSVCLSLRLNITAQKEHMST